MSLWLNRAVKNIHFRKVVLLVAVLLLSISSIFAARKERLLDTWQPAHFEVNLTLNDSLTELTTVTTEVTVIIRKDDVTMIDFDFGTMPVKGVTVDGAAARFAQHDEKLDVYLTTPAKEKQRFKIAVTYSGVPKDGLTMTKDRDGLPSAVGDNWPDRVHHWIPCFDHPSAKASVRFTVTAAAKNEVTANGILESKKENPDGTRTWVYYEKAPISPYNMVIAAGQFATAQLKTKTAYPVFYYVTHSDRKFAEHGFSTAGPSAELFSEMIAPYPYEKLALIVGATKFGGMENANTIVFYPDLFKDLLTKKPRYARYDLPEGVQNVVAHEIAHQWFGDSVTEATWADLWLSEGFATYFAGIFLEKNESPAAFRAYMKKAADAYIVFAKKRRIPIHDTETESLFDLLNANNYEKGSWVLHTLRGVVGDKDFFAGLRQFYKNHEDGTATTEDLRAAMEKASGKDLKHFFTRWIYQAGHPVYQTSWRQIDKNNIEIKLTQTQADDAFLLPVTLEIDTGKTKKRVQMNPTGKESVLRLKSAKPQHIVIDPDGFILKEVISE